MKILHVLPTFDLAAGGPPRIALRLAAATAALGHDLALLSYAPPPSARSAVDAERAAVADSGRVTFHELPAPTARVDRLLGRSALRALEALVASFDVVHLHDVWTPISRVAMSAAAAASVPFVLLPNGMLDPWSLAQKRWKKRVALALGLRRLMDRAAFLHVGNADEERGVRLAGLTAPCVIIPNGVNPVELAAPAPPPGGPPYILFLGRLHYKKGLDYLAAAFAIVAAKHPDVRLVVAGPDDGAAESFRAAIAAAGLAGRVELPGPIFSADRFSLLAGAAVFCLPSRQEGFSVAILEAMASGVPVVVSDACHFPEVAEAGAGEVVPLDVPMIAAALDRVLSDPNRAAMGAAGRALVLSRYTWPRVAEQLVSAYRAHF
jgi:glycosyltransferase involved in cell wall biosynthesis